MAKLSAVEKAIKALRDKQYEITLKAQQENNAIEASIDVLKAQQKPRASRKSKVTPLPAAVNQ